MVDHRRAKAVGRRAVTFDLWYTLIYLEPDEQEAYLQELADGLGGLASSWPPARGSSRGASSSRETDPVAAFWETFRACVAEGARGRSVSIREQGRRVAARLGRRADPDAYYRLVSGIVRRQPLKATPGARAALRELRARGWRVGLISNTVGEPGTALRRRVRALGLGPSIQAWAFSDELPWTKPAPQIFRYALRALGSSPDRAAHVGDGGSDVVGARRAGFRAPVRFEGAPAYSPTYRELFGAGAGPGPRARFRVAELEALPDLLESAVAPPATGRERRRSPAAPRARRHSGRSRA